ncbi:MAG: hypothetical protein M3065_18300 [Actinomycetota bacterium]|nr:hypothetical protein [Actinomycetota bacterium]
MAVYRKIHLWDEEARWFSPEEERAPVIDTRYVRIGLAVCYDIEFQEFTRGLALEGAELIALPANWPRDDGAPNGRPILHFARRGHRPPQPGVRRRVRPLRQRARGRVRGRGA